MGEVVVSSEERMDVELETEDEMKINKNENGDGTREQVRWEKFLPRMVLRVLLVEADDSTRQIIAALLRKCNYKVAAVSDGLKAWETLQKKPQDIDLILTEVELPSISGFALLSLVMEHDICKNLPVIMMSSHDSISLVLKCMLKGATDFLIKPVRRNELKNLWQHVWRRHTLGGHTSPNLSFPQGKAEETSETNTASSSDGCTDSTLKNKECSKKGSDAHSSCTRPHLEAESAYMQNMQDLSQLTQLKCRSASNLSNIDSEKHEESAKTEKELVKHDGNTGEKSIRFVSEAENCSEAFNSTDSGLKDYHGFARTVTQDEVIRPQCNRGNANMTSNIHASNNELFERSTRAIDLIGTFGNLPKTTNVNCRFDGGGTSKFDFAPHLELSLRRLCPHSLNKQATDETQALNHSNASAFSWYNGGKPLQTLFPALSSSSSKVNDDVCNSHESNQFCGNTIDTSQQHAATSHNQEKTTTLFSDQSEPAELQLPRHQLGQIPVSEMRFDNICTGYSDVFQSLFYRESGAPPVSSPKATCKLEDSPFPSNASIQPNPEIQNSEQGYQWSDGASYISMDQNVHDQNNLEPAKEVSGTYGSMVSGNATLTMVVENAPQSFNDGGHDAHDGLGTLDSHHFSQREAALTKFRLKRKDRCYEKKVRYQSRKRLAEQRPRVKGQFVRHVHAEHAVADGATGF
ncbi:Two-component response regulator [Quillaja saponaria]|uniref:Two-component response regulator n=1 Tax=Quillaja saponaria TaxID=32244 RepID=A0AAD7LSA2_QUISA|nr:Two-component response regulator [Quillaja saponaria]